MSRTLILEDFSDDSPAEPGFAPPESPADLPLPDLPASGAPLPTADPSSVDDVEDAYERGYRAGWDDCEQRNRDNGAAVGAELARNLQELGFTYHEARAHVMSGIEPLLDSLIGKVLPRLVAETLGPAILEELRSVAEEAADGPVTILVSPQSHDIVAGYLTDSTPLPFRLVAEPTLGEWQVFFRLGDHERQLDLGEVLDRILARFSAFKDQNDKVLKHG